MWRSSSMADYGSFVVPIFKAGSGRAQPNMFTHSTERWTSDRELVAWQGQACGSHRQSYACVAAKEGEAEARTPAEHAHRIHTERLRCCRGDARKPGRVAGRAEAAPRCVCSPPASRRDGLLGLRLRREDCQRPLSTVFPARPSCSVKQGDCHHIGFCTAFGSSYTNN